MGYDLIAVEKDNDTDERQSQIKNKITQIP